MDENRETVDLIDGGEPRTISLSVREVCNRKETVYYLHLPFSRVSRSCLDRKLGSFLVAF